MRSLGPSENRPGKNCSARSDAARRLGLDAPPAINPLAVRAVQVIGSKQQFIEFARPSEDEGVRGLVQRWDRLSPSDRRAVSICDLCAAASVHFSKLLGEVTAQAFDSGMNVSGLLAAVIQPQVVKAMVKSALRLGPPGVKDRQKLLAHSGFLPMPKGATVFRIQQQINSAHELKGGETTPLPSFSADRVAFNSDQRAALLTEVNAESPADAPPARKSRR
jgi:hypothetical protein